MDPATVNPQIIDAIHQVQAATMAPQIAGSAGKAYDAVAQAAAIVVQDAVDALRNATTTANAAAGIALAQYLESGDPAYLAALDATARYVTTAIENFSAAAAAAADSLKEFPSG
jgi:N-acetylglucosamine-6-phosphate deacetylase